MARVVIPKELEEEIRKKFKKDSKKIFKLLNGLKENPKKGKTLGYVDRIVIKEIKYKSFRFFFVTDGYLLRFHSEEELINLLIKFVRMAHKNYQQKTIEEIKNIIRKIGPKGL